MSFSRSSLKSFTQQYLHAQSLSPCISAHFIQDNTPKKPCVCHKSMKSCQDSPIMEAIMLKTLQYLQSCLASDPTLFHHDIACLFPNPNCPTNNDTENTREWPKENKQTIKFILVCLFEYNLLQNQLYLPLQRILYLFKTWQQAITTGIVHIPTWKVHLNELQDHVVYLDAIVKSLESSSDAKSSFQSILSPIISLFLSSLNQHLNVIESTLNAFQTLSTDEMNLYKSLIQQVDLIEFMQTSLSDHTASAFELYSITQGIVEQIELDWIKLTTSSPFESLHANASQTIARVWMQRLLTYGTTTLQSLKQTIQICRDNSDSSKHWHNMIPLTNEYNRVLTWLGKFMFNLTHMISNDAKRDEQSMEHIIQESQSLENMLSDPCNTITDKNDEDHHLWCHLNCMHRLLSHANHQGIRVHPKEEFRPFLYWMNVIESKLRDSSLDDCKTKFEECKCLANGLHESPE